MRGVYIVKNHPKYMNGQWDEDQVLRHFLECFEMGHHVDGIVSICFYFQKKERFVSNNYFLGNT